MRPGTSGQSGKIVPTHFTDPEVDAPKIAPGSEIWTQPSMWTDHTGTRFSTHCKRTLISARTERRRSHAMERSPLAFSTLPTMVRRQLKRTRYRRYYCRLDQLSDILGTGLSERISMLRRSRGFFVPRRGVSGRDQGPRMKRSNIQQLKLRTRCARCRKLGLWARECLEGNRGQRNDERYDRRAVRPGENSKGFITHGTRTFLSRRFLDIRHSRPWIVLWVTGAQEGLVGKQQLEKWC